MTDINITDVYKAIYSDLPFQHKGKQYPCFSAALSKTFQNFNEVYGQFDKPGPEFYTGV